MKKISVSLFFSFCCFAKNPVPKFEMETIDNEVGIGYGVQLADMNADNMPDILLVDKDKVAWYENPTWKKHILVGHLTKRDHVCLTARDLNGDGQAEIALGGEWNPNDTINSGAIFYLHPREGKKNFWSATPIRHEPTTHRMHWVKGKKSSYYLVVKPLHGRGNKNNQGEPLKVIAYERPVDSEDGKWKETIVCEFLHNSHNFHPLNWDGDEEEEILITGMEGTWLLDRKNGKWQKTMISQTFGGEVRDGFDQDGNRFVTTIEPRHGSVVAVYVKNKNAWSRVVLDSSLKDGHALVTGDFLGLGYDQIVAGWRAMRPSGAPGIRLYHRSSGISDWESYQITTREVAVEDLKVGDLNQDGSLDIVASGRQTKNLVILWNQNK